MPSKRAKSKKSKLNTTVFSYAKNVGKSLGYSLIDEIKDANPVITGFTSNNADTIKQIYHSVTHLDKIISKTTKDLIDSEYGELGKYAIQNIKEDLKTGKFYNLERKEKASDDAVSDILGDDFDFDFDINIGLEDNDELDDHSMMDLVGKKTSEAISDSIIRTTEYSVGVQTQIAAAQSDENRAIYSNLHSAMSTINTNIGKLIEIGTGPLTTHMDNSQKYFETSTTLDTERNEILKKLLELQSGKKEQKESVNSRKYMSDIVDENGLPYLADYFEVIQKNISNLGNGELALIKELVKSGAVKSLLASPLEFITKTTIKKAFPNILKTAMNDFNKTLSGAFTSSMALLNDAEENNNKILETLKSVFGVDQLYKKSISTANYEKGPIPFDGITKKSIVEVIPAYLSRIESSLTKNSEYRFDYETGKFVNIKDIENRIESMFKQSKNFANMDVKEYLDEYIQRIDFGKNKQREDEFKKAIDYLLDRSFNRGILFNEKQFKDTDSSEIGLTTEHSETDYEIIKNMFKFLPKEVVMQYSGGVYREKGNITDQMKNYEKQGGSILSNIYNNSMLSDYTKRNDREKRLKNLVGDDNLNDFVQSKRSNLNSALEQLLSSVDKNKYSKVFTTLSDNIDVENLDVSLSDYIRSSDFTNILTELIKPELSKEDFANVISKIKTINISDIADINEIINEKDKETKLKEKDKSKSDSDTDSGNKEERSNKKSNFRDLIYESTNTINDSIKRSNELLENIYNKFSNINISNPFYSDTSNNTEKETNSDNDNKLLLPAIFEPNFYENYKKEMGEINKAKNEKNRKEVISKLVDKLLNKSSVRKNKYDDIIKILEDKISNEKFDNNKSILDLLNSDEFNNILNDDIKSNITEKQFGKVSSNVDLIKNINNTNLSKIKDILENNLFNKSNIKKDKYDNISKSIFNKINNNSLIFDENVDINKYIESDDFSRIINEGLKDILTEKQHEKVKNNLIDYIKSLHPEQILLDNKNEENNQYEEELSDVSDELEEEYKPKKRKKNNIQDIEYDAMTEFDKILNGELSGITKDGKKIKRKKRNSSSEREEELRKLNRAAKEKLTVDDLVDDQTIEEETFLIFDEINKRIKFDNENLDLTDEQKKEKQEKEKINAKKPKTLLEKMKTLGGISKGMETFVKGIDTLTTKPLRFLTSVIKKADESIYKLLFGVEYDDNGDQKSVAKVIFDGLKDTFDTFKDWMDEHLFKHIKKYFNTEGTLGNKIKTIYDQIKEDFKETEFGKRFSKFFKDTKNETINTVTDTAAKVVNTATEGSENIESIDNAIEGLENEIGNTNPENKKKGKKKKSKKKNKNINDNGVGETVPNHASGTRKVSKTGIVAVSEGEMIIPPDLNPYNVEKRLEDENEAKARFSNSLFDSINNYAKGSKKVKLNNKNNDSIDKESKSKDKEKKIDEIKRWVNLFKEDKKAAVAAFRNLSEKEQKRIVEGIKNYKNGEILGEYTDSIFSLLGNIGSSVKKRATEVIKEEYNGIEEEDEINQIFKKFNINMDMIQNGEYNLPKDLREYLPEVTGGAALGGGISLLTGAIGGPLVGAAVGASVSLLKNSKEFNDFLFGELDRDGKRTGGLFSKEFSQKFQYYAPTMGKGAMLGAISSLIMPYGPLIGTFLGSAIGYASITDKIKDEIFGPDKILEGFDKKVQKRLPAMGLGALTGAVAGPFGLLPNLLLGTVAGYAADSDKFKDFMFGTEDASGKRTGGAIESVIKGVFKPVSDFGMFVVKDFTEWFEKDVKRPFIDGIEPIAYGFKNLFTTIGEKIGIIFEKKFGVPFHKMINSITSKVLGFAKGLFKMAIAPIKFVASSPFKALGFVGNMVLDSQIKRGTAGHKTAEERIARRESAGFLRHPGIMEYSKRFAAYDNALAEMSGKDAKELNERMKYVTRGREYFNLKNTEAYDEFDKAIRQNKKLGTRQTASIIKPIKNFIKKGGDVNQAYEIAHKKINQLDLPQKEKDVMIQAVDKFLATAKENQERYSKFKNNKKAFIEELKNYEGFKDIDIQEKDLPKLAKYLKTEYEAKGKFKEEVEEDKNDDKSFNTEELNENQQTRHQESMSKLDNIIELLRESFIMKNSRIDEITNQVYKESGDKFKEDIEEIRYKKMEKEAKKQYLHSVKDGIINSAPVQNTANAIIDTSTFLFGDGNGNWRRTTRKEREKEKEKKYRELQKDKLNKEDNINESSEKIEDATKLLINSTNNLDSVTKTVENKIRESVDNIIEIGNLVEKSKDNLSKEEKNNISDSIYRQLTNDLFEIISLNYNLNNQGNSISSPEENKNKLDESNNIIEEDKNISKELEETTQEKTNGFIAKAEKIFDKFINILDLNDNSIDIEDDNNIPQKGISYSLTNNKERLNFLSYLDKQNKESVPLTATSVQSDLKENIEESSGEDKSKEENVKYEVKDGKQYKYFRNKNGDWELDKSDSETVESVNDDETEDETSKSIKDSLLNLPFNMAKSIGDIILGKEDDDRSFFGRIAGSIGNLLFGDTTKKVAGGLLTFFGIPLIGKGLHHFFTKTEAGKEITNSVVGFIDKLQLKERLESLGDRLIQWFGGSGEYQDGGLPKLITESIGFWMDLTKKIIPVATKLLIENLPAILGGVLEGAVNGIGSLISTSLNDLYNYTRGGTVREPENYQLISNGNNTVDLSNIDTDTNLSKTISGRGLGNITFKSSSIDNYGSNKVDTSVTYTSKSSGGYIGDSGSVSNTVANSNSSGVAATTAINSSNINTTSYSTSIDTSSSLTESEVYQNMPNYMKDKFNEKLAELKANGKDKVSITDENGQSQEISIEDYLKITDKIIKYKDNDGNIVEISPQELMQPKYFNLIDKILGMDLEPTSSERQQRTRELGLNNDKTLAGIATKGIGKTLLTGKKPLLMNAMAKAFKTKNGKLSILRTPFNMLDSVLTTAEAYSSKLIGGVNKNLITSTQIAKGLDNGGGLIDKGLSFIKGDLHSVDDSTLAQLAKMQQAGENIAAKRTWTDRLLGRTRTNVNATLDEAKNRAEKYIQNASKNTVNATSEVAENAVKNTDNIVEVSFKNADNVAANTTSSVAENAIKNADDIADAASDLTKTGQDMMNKQNKGLIAKILDKFKSLVTKFLDSDFLNKQVGKILKKLGKDAGDKPVKKIINTIKDIVLNKIYKKFADSFVGKKALVAIAKMNAIMAGPIGMVVDIAFLITAFINGYKNANSTFGIVDKVMEPTLAMRLISGFVAVLCEKLSGGILTPGFVVDSFLKISDLLGFDNEELQDARAKSEEIVKDYNDEMGTDLSLEEYNKKDQWTTKVANKAKEIGSNIVSGTKNFFSSLFGGGSEENTTVTQTTKLSDKENNASTNDVDTSALYYSETDSSTDLAPVINTNTEYDTSGYITNIQEQSDINSESIREVYTYPLSTLEASTSDVNTEIEKYISNIEEQSENTSKNISEVFKKPLTHIRDYSSDIDTELDAFNEEAKYFSDALEKDNKNISKKNMTYSKLMKDNSSLMNKFKNNSLFSNLFKSFTLMTRMTLLPTTLITADNKTKLSKARKTLLSVFGNNSNLYSGSGSDLPITNSNSSSDNGTFISQLDSRYSSKSFNIQGDNEKQTIADTGCGPAAAAMVINNAYNNKAETINIKDAAKTAIKYKEQDGGVNAAYFEDEFSRYGLQTQYIDGNSDSKGIQIANNLRNGNRVVLMGQDYFNDSKSKSPFGPKSHYIVATGISDDGKYMWVNDPEANRPNIKYKTSTILNNSKLGIAGVAANGSNLINNIRNKISNKFNRFLARGSYGVDTVQYQVWIRLIAGGLTEIQAAAIMGNIEQESRFDPNRIQAKTGAGFGLCQWSYGRRKQIEAYASSVGKPAGDIDLQVKFLLAELNPNGGCNGYAKYQLMTTKYEGKSWDKNLFLVTNDLTIATKAFCYCWERCHEKDAMMDVRLNAAKKYYTEFTGTVPNMSDFNNSTSSLLSNSSLNTSTSSEDSSSDIFTELQSAFSNLAIGFGLKSKSESTDTNSNTTYNTSSTTNVDSSSYGEYVRKNPTNLQEALVDKMHSIEGQLAYSQSRRNPDNGSGDCSSTVQWAYKKVLGVDPGSYSGAQKIDDDTYTVTNTLNESLLQPGDLILYNGHVEMYAGQGKMIGHGGGSDGTKKGPFLANLSNMNGRFQLVRRWKGFRDGFDPNTIPEEYRSLATSKTNKSTSLASTSSLREYSSIGRNSILYNTLSASGSGLESKSISNIGNTIPEEIKMPEVEDIKIENMSGSGSDIDNTKTTVQIQQPNITYKAPTNNKDANIIKTKVVEREQVSSNEDINSFKEIISKYFKVIIELLEKEVANTSQIGVIVKLFTEIEKLNEKEKNISGNDQNALKQKQDIQSSKANLLSVVSSLSSNISDQHLNSLINQAQRIASI